VRSPGFLRQLNGSFISDDDAQKKAEGRGRVSGKGQRLLCREAKVEDLYEFIEAEKANHPVVWLCRALNVSRASFYRWRKPANPSPHTVRHQKLVTAVTELHCPTASSPPPGWPASPRKVSPGEVVASHSACGARLNTGHNRCHSKALNIEGVVMERPVNVDSGETPRASRVRNGRGLSAMNSRPERAACSAAPVADKEARR
jgi:hypothetical protein